MPVKILILLLTLLAGPALGFTFDDCNGNVSGELYTIHKYDLTCIAALPADSTNDTAAVHVRAKAARVCFTGQIDAAGASLARMKVHHCANGKMPSATPEVECPWIGIEFTGAEGASQLACATFDTGTYFFEISTAIEAGDVGRITVQGLGD